MADTTTDQALSDTLAIAALLAQLLPAGVELYQKIQQNNQNAGLVPVETLLEDAIGLGTTIEQAADAEIAANEPKDGTAPQAPAQTS